MSKKKRPARFEALHFQGPGRRGEVQAEWEGARVAVFGGAPGDLAQTMIGRRKKGVRLGWLQDVVKPAPGRVEPRCPHFGRCGGCAYQHLGYATQLSLKSAPVLAQLEPYLRKAEVLPTVPAPSQFYYRSKVEFSCMGEPARVGFNRRGRWDRLAAVRECFIGPPPNRAVLGCVDRWAGRHRLPGWNPRANQGALRYLVLRYAHSTGQWLAALVTTPEELPVEELGEELRKLGATGFIHARQSSCTGAVRPDKERLVMGRDCIQERLEDLTFDLSWRSFYQSNPPAYLEMLREARAWTQPRGVVLDLFCGVGTIGLFLSTSEARLVGVEVVSEAVMDARRSAARGGREADFHCCASEEWEDFVCDLLILDPPRSGCHPRLVRRVAEEGPERVLYISCNPGRLVEEMETLGSGYRIRRFRLFDFFPNTRHLEALALLERF